MVYFSLEILLQYNPMLLNIIFYLAEDMVVDYDVAEGPLLSCLRYGCWLWCCQVPFLL